MCWRSFTLLLSGILVYLRRSSVSPFQCISVLFFLILLCLGLCLCYPPLPTPPKCYPRMVFLTTSARVPLFVILPNLRFHTLWVEAEVTIHALLVRGPLQRSPRHLSSVWDVLILLQIPQLRREIPIHCRCLFLVMSRP